MSAAQLKEVPASIAHKNYLNNKVIIGGGMADPPPAGHNVRRESMPNCLNQEQLSVQVKDDR